MKAGELDAAVEAVFARLFGLVPEQIADGLARGRLEQWDSLGHLNLIEELNGTFRIQIPPEAALDLETVGDVKRMVEELCAKRH
jgi:acyl carrier protein